uniref:Uncharacterized protein n=1 Tax=Physcomitrium patens TaxID=3218 RepID=A0A2K1L148_PHYPA|nr:hypothetical protein PHYPA_002545 [Physcomitrium patens]
MTGVVSSVGCNSSIAERPSHPCDVLVAAESFANVAD